jgi:hypothetical protein
MKSLHTSLKVSLNDETTYLASVRTDNHEEALGKAIGQSKVSRALLLAHMFQLMKVFFQMVQEQLHSEV